jgi:hypothetical protein
MLFVVMTNELPCFLVSWRELQEWISTSSRIISPYLTLYHACVSICECVVFAFYPVLFTDLYMTPIKTPLYCILFHKNNILMLKTLLYEGANEMKL